MSILGSRWRSLQRWILRRPGMEEGMDAEMQFHLDALTEDLIRSGVPREEARRRARMEFGAIDTAKEECRDTTGANVVEGFFHDMRHGLRILARNPGFTGVALLSLALGIGANSTVFSLVDSYYLRPWPVRQPDRLVAVECVHPKDPDYTTASHVDFADIARETSAFSDVVAYGNRGGYIAGDGQGRAVSVEVVSPNFFSAVGVNAIRGRVFAGRADDTSAESHAVVISYGLWLKHFNADPAIAGRATRLDGQPFTIIGVMPPEFRGLRRDFCPHIWVTTGGWDTMVPGERAGYAERDARWFRVVGRLGSGIEIASARAQLNVLGARLSQAAPGTELRAHPAAENSGEGFQIGVYLMAMVGLVLLISCANVANLLLAHTERRRREMAMRRALGAGRGRLVRQLLAEGLLLSIGGGIAGVAIALVLMKVLPVTFSALADVDMQMDGRVLLFTAVVSLSMTVVFGLAPAFRAAKDDLIPALKGEGTLTGHHTGRQPVRSLLVSGEIALAVVLLVSSTLLLRSLLYSRQINPGFDVKKNVVLVSVAPPTLYGYSDQQAAELYPKLTERVEQIPGVVRATYSRRPPLTADEAGETYGVTIPGVQPPPGAERFKIRYNVVAPKFFATLGTRIEQGREFDNFDQPSKEPVVMINGAMARRFWPNENPLGRSIRVGRKDRRIVGVVETGRYVSLQEQSQSYLFLPFTQEFSFEGMLLVETAADPRALMGSIVRAAASIDPRLPVVNAITLADHMDELLAAQRSLVTLLAGLSVLGMFLASVGLYASIAYIVQRRSHEIGVRVAIGAARGDILRMVLGQGLRLSAAGTLVGLIGAFGVSRLAAGWIYGVTPGDPLSYAASVAVATAVALLATYLPARQAMRVDPMIALRRD